MPRSHYSLAAFIVALGCAEGRPAEAPSPSPAPPPAASSAAPTSSPAAAVPAAAPPTARLTTGITVEIKNPLSEARPSETIALRLTEVRKFLPTLDAKQAIVQDANGAPVLSQLVDTDGDEQADEWVFQTNLAAGESKTFILGQGSRSAPTRDQFKVYGRFVRERHDDFAWENDRVAHRVYGPDLETYAKDPLVSSGVDVWVKRTPRLLINEWYQSDDYHRDNGDGGDFYSVGPSRGCGGLGIWDGKQLHVSRNFSHSRVLANGPIRLIFELSYAPWDAGGGLQVSETKRVTVDAGQHFNRFESTFTFKGKPSGHSLGIGISKHKDAAFETDPANGILRSWEQYADNNGHLGCAVLAASGSASGFAEIASDRLLLLPLTSGTPTAYFVGTGWDKSGDIADNAAWTAQVNERARASRSPVVVSLSPLPNAHASAP